MGMFTTLITKCGRRYQFKTGHDECEEFLVTATLPNRPVRGYPGEMYIGDGVYHGYLEYTKDGIEHEITIVVKGDRFVDLLPGTITGHAESKLYCQYQLQAPDPGLWTTEEWADKAVREYKHKSLSYLEDAELAGVRKEYMGIAHIRRYTRKMLKETSFLDLILGKAVKPSPTFAEEQRELFRKFPLDRIPSLDAPAIKVMGPSKE